MKLWHLRKLFFHTEVLKWKELFYDISTGTGTYQNCFMLTVSTHMALYINVNYLVQWMKQKIFYFRNNISVFSTYFLLSKSNLSVSDNAVEMVTGTDVPIM